MWKYAHTTIIAALTGLSVVSACDPAVQSVDDSGRRGVESAETPLDQALLREASERMKADLSVVEFHLDSLPD
jgi:hypothetical protein